jgi:hypothetical protein
LLCGGNLAEDIDHHAVVESLRIYNCDRLHYPTGSHPFNTLAYGGLRIPGELSDPGARHAGILLQQFDDLEVQ